MQRNILDSKLGEKKVEKTDGERMLKRTLKDWALYNWLKQEAEGKVKETAIVEISLAEKQYYRPSKTRR